MRANVSPFTVKERKAMERENADETDFVCKYKLKHEVGIDVDELDSMFDFQIVMKKGG